ncbi:MAG TPA: hypothetical protein VFF73_25490 [Planctomycetota bacterium]|nr:hypothetical protein [Planctomycetota bacterium]
MHSSLSLRLEGGRLASLPSIECVVEFMDRTRRLQLTVAFDEGSLGGREVAALVRELKLPRVHVGGEHAKRGAKFSERWLSKVEKTPSPRSVRVDGIDLASLSERQGLAGWSRFFYVSLSRRSEKAIWIALPDELPSDEELEALTRRPGFIFGHCGDHEDLKWQSETSVEAYRTAGRDFSHLPRDTKFPPPLEFLDIRTNPGRESFFLGIMLTASWRMWFGPGIRRFIPHERVLTFDGARRVDKFSNNVVFAELFADPLDAETPNGREIQRRFREWTGMDFLEQHVADYEQRPDPCFSIEEGVFEHGGDRRLSTWLDARGKPTNQSRAVFKHVVEIRIADGARWEERIRVRSE